MKTTNNTRLVMLTGDGRQCVVALQRPPRLVWRGWDLPAPTRSGGMRSSMTFRR